MKPPSLTRFVAQFDDRAKAVEVERCMVEDGATFNEATRLFGFAQGEDFILFMEELDEE